MISRLPDSVQSVLAFVVEVAAVLLLVYLGMPLWIASIVMALLW